MKVERYENGLIAIEDAKIWSLNFSGAAGRYNNLGDRNFCVDIPPEFGRILQEEGWNVKWHKARDDEEDPNAFIQVKVNYNVTNPRFRPRIYILKSDNKKELLNEKTVSAVDDYDIEFVDLEIRPRSWTLESGKSGIKAYLSEAYIKIAESMFSRKYSDYNDTENVDDDDMPF